MYSQKTTLPVQLQLFFNEAVAKEGKAPVVHAKSSQSQPEVHDVSLTDQPLALYHHLLKWSVVAIASGPTPWGNLVVVDGGVYDCQVHATLLCVYV